MCRRMIHASVAPSERAARTYTSLRTVITEPRAMRAKIGMYTMPMAIIALVSPGPRTATMAMASRIAGKANSMSIRRISTPSVARP